MTVEVMVQREFAYYLKTMVMVLMMLSSFTLSVIKMHPVIPKKNAFVVY